MKTNENKKQVINNAEVKKALFEKLEKGNCYDKLLLKYLIACNLPLNCFVTLNRGDIAESTITRQRVKRDGLQEVSNGDVVLRILNKMENVEIKYVSKKTGASKQGKGTTCKYHLVMFNSGKEIFFKIIETKDITYDKSGRICYLDNINKGTIINVFRP